MSLLTQVLNPAHQAGHVSHDYAETRLQRLIRYNLLWAYYENTMYDSDILASLDASAAKRAQEVLYTYVKPVFNVCTRAVSVDVGSVLADPVRVTSELPGIEQAIVDTWKRSKFQARLNRMLRYGSAYGDAYLRLYDETSGKPKIMLHPPTEMDIEVDPHDPDQIERAILTYNYFEGDKRCDYRMEITADAYYTFLDDEPTTFDGYPAPEWENALRVVPVVPVRLLDYGDVYGAPTFHSVLPQLDAVNEVASQLAQIVRMHADPQLVAYGMEKQNLSKGATKKGEVPIWYVNGISPVGMPPRLEFLEWSGNVTGVAEFLTFAKDAVHESLAELHLKKVRDGAAPSGYSVRLQLTEMLIKIGEMRRNAIEALRQINTLALYALGMVSDIEDAEGGSHDITAGDILPADEAADAGLVYQDLENGLIDEEEALKRRHYDKKDADAILKRVREAKKQKAEENARRFAPGYDNFQDVEPGMQPQGANNGAPGQQRPTLPPQQPKGQAQ